MRCRILATLVLLAAILAGCGSVKSVPIAPVPDEQKRTDLGLGPGIRPLTSGPGDKSVPRWGPGDERISFIMDGYVVEKPPYTRELRRKTTRDFGADNAQWITSKNLLVQASDSVYTTLPGEGSLGVRRVATGALAMSPGPEGEGALIALESGPYESGLVIIERDGGVDQIYTDLVGGSITGLSMSPEDSRVVLAIRGVATYALYVVNLADGETRKIARLKPGLEIFGAPQWTNHGIYYVAGENTGEDTAPYHLYRIASRSNPPEPAPGMGEDFVTSSLRVSPDGERLAVIGRRNPNSSTNLYILDLASNRLEAATSNEDMEIKTDPEDLAWARSGDGIVIVARSMVPGAGVHAAPADLLLADFYNLYEVPVGDRKGDEG